MAPDRGEPDAVLQPDNTSHMSNLDINSEAETPTPTSTPTPPHLSHDPATNAKRTDPFQFGQRFLSDSDDVFAYNAWDHVVPDSEHEEYCESQYSFQRSKPVSEFDKSRFNTHPEKWWDLFYKQKSATFFKDRKWLVQEFPILNDITKKDAGRRVVLEVGAGAGNTAFPILRLNENPELMVHAYDFSKKAVETMRDAPDYDERFMQAEVWDVASDTLPPSLEEESVDIVILIFIFSALSPTQWAQAVRNVHRVLKPGGEVLFRDYGRGDLAQVRFKSGRWMEENFYVRGDGTRVYFFEMEQLKSIWSSGRIGADMENASREGQITAEEASEESKDEPRNEYTAKEERVDEYHDLAGTNASTSGTSNDSYRNVEATKLTPRFTILNLDVDRRLIVNRQRRIKMYRCWIQGRFQKTSESNS